MKRFVIVCVGLVALLCVGCHKTCVCAGYNGLVTEFSADEVDAHADGNCYQMRNYPMDDQYSYCHW